MHMNNLTSLIVFCRKDNTYILVKCKKKKKQIYNIHNNNNNKNETINPLTFLIEYSMTIVDIFSLFFDLSLPLILLMSKSI